MSRLMAPISSPTSTSTRESVARADCARPRGTAVKSAAPAAAAPAMNGRLRLRVALEPRVCATEVVVSLGRFGVERRHLLKLGDRVGPALGAYVELGEREARRHEGRVELCGLLKMRLYTG